MLFIAIKYTQNLDIDQKSTSQSHRRLQRHVMQAGGCEIKFPNITENRGIVVNHLGRSSVRVTTGYQCQPHTTHTASESRCPGSDDGESLPEPEPDT